VTILVSSHDLLHTVEVSDRIVAMHKGEVVKHSNFTRNITKLEQFCSLKLFMGHDQKKSVVGLFPIFFILKNKKDSIHPSCKGFKSNNLI
jgi:ABC-type multidrug transport system ATPase subunit